MNLSDLLELETSWNFLSGTKLPVFIYGMGDGCLKLMREFEKYKIPVAGIFASDEFVRGHSFQGHLVHKLSDIEAAFGCENFVIALAFAAGYPSLIQLIDKINAENILLAPDTDVIGTGAFTRELFRRDFDKIERVYSSLFDEKSREVYYNVIAFKLTGKIDYLKKITTTPHEAYKNILKLGYDECYVDLGAFTGDTIEEFLSHTNRRYKKIYAVEPNSRNFRKLTENAAELENCKLINAAAWSEETTLVFNKGGGRQSQVSEKGKETAAVSVDYLLGGEAATYIKYDVEGAEAQAIKGAESTIGKYSPKLCVALYHKAADLYELPLQILKINPDYKLFIRHFPYYPAWETNLFAVKD